MKTYDIILTLGNGFTDHWGVPTSVENRLRNIEYLYKHKVSNKILLWAYSINWDLAGIKTPTTEAREMKKELIRLGVPEEKLYIEEESKDTIGNFYFSKIKFLKPNNWKHILVVATDFHLKRVKLIAKKILGEEYHVSYQTTPSDSFHDEDFIKSQEWILEMQDKFLNAMQTGDDDYLAKRLYNDPYYKIKRPEKIMRATMKGII